MQISSGKTLNLANLTQSMQRISEATTRMFQNNAENSIQWFSELQDVFGSGLNIGKKKDDCGACPPECDCPPQCLLNIYREANPGETIIVPFKVKNTLQTAKIYRIGVRPLYDDNGNLLPNQPVLNKTVLNLQPGQSILVEMKIDLTNGYLAGNRYSTEIVIREKEVNQNICFTLNVTSNTCIPEAHPLKEQDYLTHFNDWKSHYYCDSRPTITRVNPSNNNG